MNKKTNEELQALIEEAVTGDKKALELLIADVQDIVFNLSLRMLGTFADAEDATQDILYDVSSVKKDVQKHAEKIIEIEASAKQAHHRLDGLEDRLNAREVQE